MEAPEHFEVWKATAVTGDRVTAHWPRRQARSLRVAMVVRPEMVDPDNFEVTVARNRRLMGNVFDCTSCGLSPQN
jgi:hypothetical protein